MTLLETARALRHELAAFDPAVLSGEDRAFVAEQLIATAKACTAAAVRAAQRAAECRAHERRGFSDPPDWLARVSGSSVGEARSALATAGALQACPATAEALAHGELSLAQAEVIVGTETVCPGSETDMLDLARRSSLVALRDEGRRRRLAAVDPEELHRRQHRARSWRHWRDSAGMVNMAGALPPELGVRIVNRLEAETDRIRREARRQGTDEPRAAHMADALVKLLVGQGQVKGRGADLVVVCDLGAWRRGRAHQGEVCHLVGGGPVPVSVAQEMADDAFLKAVVHDGVRIDTVAHFGRHIPAELRTALDLGSPPGFEGVCCVEEGCGRRYGLEWDHLDPVANGGATSFENLQPQCWVHHRAKTERDRQAGLLGARGRKAMNGRARPDRAGRGSESAPEAEERSPP